MKKKMIRNRRDVLAGSSWALFGAGFLSRVDKVAAQQRSPSLIDEVGRQASGESEKLLLPVQADAEGPPEPAAYDRLPLEWNKRTVARFKERLAERGWKLSWSATRSTRSI